MLKDKIVELDEMYSTLFGLLRIYENDKEEGRLAILRYVIAQKREAVTKIKMKRTWRKFDENNPLGEVAKRVHDTTVRRMDAHIIGRMERYRKMLDMINENPELLITKAVINYPEKLDELLALTKGEKE